MFPSVLQITVKLLQITTAFLITNYDEELLQITTAFLLQITTKFLQIATGIANYDKSITNYDRYYKLRQLLQITTEQ